MTNLATLKFLDATPEFHAYGKAYDALNKRMPLGPIVDAEHHEKSLLMVSVLGELLDEGKVPPRAIKDITAYAQALTAFIKAYEAERYEAGSVKGIDVLKDLMAMHELNQSSFQEEIGDQPVVSRILQGERQLTRAHVEKLAVRFNVSPAVFFDRQ